MKRSICALVLCSFCAGSVLAEEKTVVKTQEKAQEKVQEKTRQNTSWKSWYNNLYKGLRSKVQKKYESKTRVSAVAAVRGAKTGRDASELYWKGGISEKAREKAEAERKDFGDAVELVVNGEAAKGRAALEKFIKENPESLYLADAKEALGLLPSPEDMESAVEQTPAPAAPAAEAAPDKNAPAPADKE